MCRPPKFKSDRVFVQAREGAFFPMIPEEARHMTTFLRSRFGFLLNSALASFLLAALTYGPVAPAQVTEQQVNVRLLEFSKSQDEARARRMIEEGASVNSRNRAGETPLLLWVKAGNAGMVAWLLEKGASVNQDALDRTTPLMAAAFAGRVDIMQTLLDAGADAERKDQVFKTAMIYAAAQGHAEAVKLLLARGVDVNRVYAHNLTALMWAAGYGKTECVQLLLASGADPKLKDDRGKTAADIAQEQGYGEVAALLKT